jgi:hypothetical protein
LEVQRRRNTKRRTSKLNRRKEIAELSLIRITS